MHARLVPSRRHRTIGAVAGGLFAVLLAWSPVLAAVSWGDLHRASTDYAYSWQQSLARTTTSAGTAYLHQLFTRDVIGGEGVEDGGPYLGIYYKRQGDFEKARKGIDAGEAAHRVDRSNA